MDITQFIYTFIVDEHLGCFPFWALMNIAAIAFMHKFLCGHIFSFSWIYTWGGIASSYGNAMFNLLRELSDCFPK